MTKRRVGPVTIDFLRSRSIICRESGCWNWQGARSAQGYGVVREGGVAKRTHRRAYELFYEAYAPSGLDVCHACDNPACVNPEHLFVGTRKDNMRDCSNKGRIRIPRLKGEEVKHSKLTENAVREIRASPLSQRDLAKAFGVSKAAVHHVLNNKTWRDEGYTSDRPLKPQAKTITIRGITYASQGEAAAALGVSPTTVCKAIKRGRVDQIGSRKRSGKGE